jgi:rRNA-processing protein EBP2
VKEWKKRRNADKGGAIRDDDDRELDEIVAGKTPVAPTGGKRKRDGGRDDRDAKKPRVNAKREAKNKKFGFGGPKKFSKSNTRESTNDTSSFPGRRQRGGAPSGKGGRATGGKAPKGKRPSKTARTKQRGKR